NGGEFYFGNRGDSPVEIKLDENPPEYPEWPPHLHNSPEIYGIYGGPMVVGVAGPEYPEDPSVASELMRSVPADHDWRDMEEELPGVFDYIEVENDSLRVPPWTPHYVAELREGEKDTAIIIARGNGEDYVSRYVPGEGDWSQTYPWADEEDFTLRRFEEPYEVTIKRF
ncbi:MAG: hypothetical protein ABEJ66_00590, partial [Candidatus Nanohaloarchaea archaeon]